MTQPTHAERIADFDALVERLNNDPVDADILQAAQGIVKRADYGKINDGVTACLFGFSGTVLSRFNQKALAKGGSGQLNSPETACAIVKRAQEISR